MSTPEIKDGDHLTESAGQRSSAARPECCRSPYLDVSVDVGMMMAAKMMQERAGLGKPARVELHLNEGELAGFLAIAFTLGAEHADTRREAPAGAQKPDGKTSAVDPLLVESHQRLAATLSAAKNILYLLTPEVSALGMRAYLIHGQIDAALAAIPEELK